MTKEKIIASLEVTEKHIKNSADSLLNRVSVNQYKDLVFKGDDGEEVWSIAFQEAINNNEILVIPSKDCPYYIDRTIIVPSGRRIEAAKDAVIKLTPNTRVLMLRNANTGDGTNHPIDTKDRDSNISIIGGIWEEPRTERAGYGKTGMYDIDRSFFGVSTMMLFNNISELCLEDMTFSHAAGFAVQVGDIDGGLFRGIRFKNCYADGVHINGNSENLILRDISGQVGDDLVALNMYDWLDSSVNFGPACNVLCENLKLSEDSTYKAIRIMPGIHRYKNGDTVDCTAKNIIFKNVSGIKTFKLYYQTPIYTGENPTEGAGAGSGDNIYFENIEINLDEPIDLLPEYINSDAVKGSFAGFELGGNFGTVSLSDININLDKDKHPMAFLACVGPKSSLYYGSEVFDPYVNSRVEKLLLNNITVNGKRVSNIPDYVHEIYFEDGGKGEIECLLVDGEQAKPN